MGLGWEDSRWVIEWRRIPKIGQIACGAFHLLEIEVAEARFLGPFRDLGVLLRGQGPIQGRVLARPVAWLVLGYEAYGNIRA
jgi:hypothetical protein